VIELAAKCFWLQRNNQKSLAEPFLKLVQDLGAQALMFNLSDSLASKGFIEFGNL
jgi:hypothetical protein